ncbi:bifunctional adenosylcobinamide kinase/adenosylcobinamide-phosphate guanylyltransferase [Rhizosaccharibacter radicis]|uniref:Bifunctional adenosylcobalamin biosynthesis protein n=1 Tax=Rhizosaccharibacter radicis TaxID=2782605 RepID=A0ABT1VYA1_9PROT|nr:bifunctional adenosylcobinamide kinase/adenosylcobinamide-phosphate guanylyltransferase [Acetobacteraceae bacterium KSS12]
MGAAASDVPGTVLVLGGARSGKSRYAEALFTFLPPPWIYIATGEVLDGEMQDRVALHRSRRDDRWRTVEVPTDLPGALDAAEDRPVLVDCLTLWLSNLMGAERDLEAAGQALDEALARRAAMTVLVGNEVGLGIVPGNALARRFRDRNGLLHQQVAARADRVVLLVAGCPVVVKGP